MAHLCQAPGCSNEGTSRCGRCTQEKFSNNFGWYCSRDCQSKHWTDHLNFHKMWVKPTTMCHYNETIMIALKDLSFQNFLPSLSETGSLALYILAATILEQSEYDDENVFRDLFGKLKTFVYPSMESLQLIVVASVSKDEETPETNPVLPSTTTKTYDIGEVQTIQTYSLESQIALIDPAHSIAWLFHPELSTNLDVYYAPCQQLIHQHILTVITGHGSVEYMNHDKVHEETIVRDYYGGQIVLPMTHNPANVDNYGDGKYAQHVFYLAFQGSHVRPLTTPEGERVVVAAVSPLLSRQEVVHRLKVRLLQQAALNERMLCQDETAAKNIERCLYDIENQIIVMPTGDLVGEQANDELLAFAEKYKL